MTRTATTTRNQAAGGRGTLAALMTLAATFVALALSAGSAQAASFGSDLDKSVQPSNSVPSHLCEAAGKCTWTMGEAYGNPGGEESSKTGYLKKLKLIAGEPGSFKLQIVKQTKSGHTKFKRNGPKIQYQGQDLSNWNSDQYKVEKFKMHVKIKAGERLAIKTTDTSALRCSSGGPNILQHNPVLRKSDGKRIYDDTDGCWLLMEGKVK